MKRLVLMLFVVGVMMSSYAVGREKRQTVSYTHKALAAEGCSVLYSVMKHDSVYYVVVSVKSDRMKFQKEPRMLIKTFSGKVLELKGTLFDTDASSFSVDVGDFSVPMTMVNTMTQFKVTREQFELLREGVAKVRLSTLPIEHERTFKKDKLGKKLYNFYLHQMNKDISF